MTIGEIASIMKEPIISAHAALNIVFFIIGCINVILIFRYAIKIIRKIIDKTKKERADAYLLFKDFIFLSRHINSSDVYKIALAITGRKDLAQELKDDFDKYYKTHPPRPNLTLVKNDE